MTDFFPQDYPDYKEFGEPPCSQSFPDAFFPEESPESSLSRRSVYLYEREAKAVCQPCPYSAECLQYALRNPELLGIWGGTTERQRKRIRQGVAVSLKLPPSRRG